MEKTLARLFDYQKFEPNATLAALIQDTESRWGTVELSDDQLDEVSAAGADQVKPHEEKSGIEVVRIRRDI